MNAFHFSLAGLLLSLLATGATAQPAAGDVAAGQRHYLALGCFACHGTTGLGGEPSGPKLAPNPLPLPAFIVQLRHPRQQMPAYSEAVVSDAEIANIRAYLASVPGGKSAAQIPLLNR